MATFLRNLLELGALMTVHAEINPCPVFSLSGSHEFARDVKILH